MDGFVRTIEEANVGELHRLIEQGDQKRLFFTKITEQGLWAVCVTDGVDLWQLQLDREGLETYENLNGIGSIQALLSGFRSAFDRGEIAASLLESKLTLRVGRGSTALNFHLFEVREAKKRTDLQGFLLHLAEKVQSLDKQLTLANQKVELLNSQVAASTSNVFVDLGPKRGGNQPSPKKPGMSAVNPTTRKIKPARGVVFD